MSSGGDFIHWSEALVFFDCPHCNGTGIDPIRVGIGDEHPCDPVDCTKVYEERDRMIAAHGPASLGLPENLLRSDGPARALAVELGKELKDA